MMTKYGAPVGVNDKLPYNPSIDDIFYVEGRHTIKIERWKIEYYYEIIKESLDISDEYVEGYFSLITRLMDTPLLWNGFSQEQQRKLKDEMIEPFALSTI